MSVERTNSEALSAYQLPAIFSLENLKNVKLGPEYSTQANRRYLAHHVKRYPLDLRAQVQRVLLNKDQEALTGVLQDLFIALKGKGFKLREMLFDQVKENLSEEDQRYFSDWLAQGEEVVNNDRFVKGSVLTKGLSDKGTALLNLSAKESSSYSSQYQEAIDCLEYGQLEDAQALLEGEMLSPEGDPRAEEELLRVYTYTKDEESKARLLALLTEQGRELSPSWTLSDTKEG
ncbi:hypothetical protein EOL70_01850 [Leucothrix sargassi]|nr:hypothetical protein EOL70_01850 [Leucothrix sargassi]